MGAVGGAFALLVGALSVWPRYRLIEPDHALVSLSFARAGQRLRECRALSPAELAALPPNMRAPSDCPRERHPVEVELWVDHELVYRAVHEPSGLWRDGESTVYARLPVPAGVRDLRIGLRDSGRAEGFDLESTTTVELPAGRNAVVELDAEHGRFVVR